MKAFRERVQNQIRASMPEISKTNKMEGTSPASPEQAVLGKVSLIGLPVYFENLVKNADRELNRGSSMVDYQYSAAIAIPRLAKLLNRFEKIPGGSDSLDSRRKIEYFSILGLIYRVMGNFDAAEHAYKAVFPHLTLEGHILVGLRESLLTGSSRVTPERSARSGHYIDLNKISALGSYLEFMLDAGRNLELVEAVVKSVPWILPTTPDVRERMLYLTVEVLVKQSRFTEAADKLALWHAIFPEASHSRFYSYAKLHSAIIAVNLGAQASHDPGFVIAVVTGYIVSHFWDAGLLHILYYFGKFLVDQNLKEAAVVILETCVLGCIHLYGTDHPNFWRAFAAIRACKISPAHANRLQRYGHPNFDRGMQLSIAYENVHLNTPIDLLQQAGHIKINYQDILNFLLSRRDVEDLVLTNYIRTIARCKFELGDVQQAIHHLLHDLPILKDMDKVAIELDLIKYSDNPLHASKTLLQRCQTQLSLDQHHREAIHRKLTAAGLTHFPYDLLVDEPSLISDTGSETIRTGASAVVDSVKIGTKVYARKSIALPRYHQKDIRDIIQNEISVLRTLDHPHIVRLYLSYEEKSRFCMIMYPFADCDLEAFLEEHTQRPPSDRQELMIHNWFLCLCNTLAYIHSQGIRHKDIKPRNILVQGEEVIFADFGSSHVFLDVDTGNSITEGPAFGHTKMYCAPEVLANGQRGRSADIFSLGCVFVELLVWLKRSSIGQWNQERIASIDGGSGIAYSATLDFVSQRLGNDPLISGVYHYLLRPMLSESPKERLTAVQISAISLSTFRAIYKKGRCQKCELGMWVD